MGRWSATVPPVEACFTRRLAPLVVIALIVKTVPNRFINAASLLRLHVAIAVAQCSLTVITNNFIEHA